MYFDVDYYLRVVRHVWSLKAWRGRNRMLVRLLLWVPLSTLFHSICFLLDYLFFPRLWRQQVVNPVFIVGHARSGSTLCHRLMAADGETFSYFLYWETFFPSLLQKKIIRALGWIDRNWLGGPIRKRLEIWDENMFGSSRHIHNMSLWTSEEDQFVMRAAFVTQQWALDVPMMDKLDLFHLDQMPGAKRRRWMHHYRECVKRQLLLNGGEGTHLSKNPMMSGWVDSIIQTFPDARFTVVMRDPAQCIPSVLKLMQFSWRGRGWKHEDYASSLHELMQISFDTFHHPRDVLARHPQTPHIVVDYRQLTTQPREIVLRIYAALGMTVSTDFDAYLREQERRERGHKTPFSYSIEEFARDGLSRQQIETRLADFYDEFGWPKASQA